MHKPTFLVLLATSSTAFADPVFASFDTDGTPAAELDVSGPIGLDVAALWRFTAVTPRSHGFSAYAHVIGVNPPLEAIGAELGAVARPRGVPVRLGIAVPTYAYVDSPEPAESAMVEPEDFILGQRAYVARAAIAPTYPSGATLFRLDAGLDVYRTLPSCSTCSGETHALLHAGVGAGFVGQSISGTAELVAFTGPGVLEDALLSGTLQVALGRASLYARAGVTLLEINDPGGGGAGVALDLGTGLRIVY